MNQSSDPAPPPHISDDFWFQVTELQIVTAISKKGNGWKEIGSLQNQQEAESPGLKRPETMGGISSSSKWPANENVF